MATHELKVQSRSETGKSAARRLRYAGQVPTVTYGHKEEPVLSSVNAHELDLLVKHGGAHGLLLLKNEGGADTPVIIKELKRHPAKHTLQSVDFLRVSLDEQIESVVPILLEGTPESVRVDGGVLVQALHELHIQSLPQNVPDHITVDVTSLEFNGAPIHVKEITLPAGVVVTTDGDEAVAVVNAPQIEEVEEPVDEAAADEVPSEHGADEITDETANEA